MLKLSEDFVLHALRHTFETRLGEAGVDGFTIMRLIGPSSIIVSQRYVHPSPAAVELEFSRFERLNRAQLEADRSGAGAHLSTVDRQGVQAVR